MFCGFATEVEAMQMSTHNIRFSEFVQVIQMSTHDVYF